MPQDQAQQYDVIGVRGIIGYFFQALEQYDGALWADMIANVFESNQDTETYAGLGQVPQLREWVGGKQAKGFNELSVKITNKDWESTLRIKNKDRRRDKSGQIAARIGELAQRAVAHRMTLLSAIIDGGTSTAITFPSGGAATVSCYDGQPLFSASHKIGATAVNNIVSNSIATAATYLGTNVGTGSTTNPSPAMMAYSILNAVQQLYGFTDDQKQPLNELARKFVVMVPIPYVGAANAAVRGQFLGVGYTNPLTFMEAPNMGQTEFIVVPNPRLTWTTQFAVFRADAPFKCLIEQLEMVNKASSDEMQGGVEIGESTGAGLVMKALAEGSDNEFWNNELVVSIEKSGMVGYGRFDQAVLSQIAS